MKERQDYAVLKDNLVLGIPVIDAQHANLMRITDNLLFTCQKGVETVNCRFIRAVEEAIDYLAYHYKTQEKLMLLLGYPDFHDHQREHEDFLLKAISRCKQFQEEHDDIDPEKFVYFLKEGIFSHAVDLDKAFSVFLMAMKHHDKLRLILSSQLSTQSA